MQFSKTLDPNTRAVFSKSVSTAIVKILGGISTIIVSVIIGRMLGPEGLGIIDLSIKILAVLLILSMFGLPSVIIKKTSVAYFSKDYQSLGHVVHSSMVFVFIVSLTLVLVLFLGIDFLSIKVFQNQELKIPLLIFLLGFIPLALSRVRVASLKGISKTWQGNLLEESLSIFIILMILSFYYVSSRSIDTRTIAIIYTASRFLVFLIIEIYWKLLIPVKPKRRNIIVTMLPSAFPLFIASTGFMIMSSIDIFMIGIFRDSAEVGFYSVAARLAMFISIFLHISNSAISPKVAVLYNNREIEPLKKLVGQVSFALVVVASLSLLGFYIFGEYILSFWGNEFTQVFPALLILAVGQFVNVSTGCSAIVLSMCGYEKYVGIILAIATVVNIMLNYVLILNFGYLGAAITTAVVVIIENVLKTVYAYKRTGILTLPTLFKKS